MGSKVMKVFLLLVPLVALLMVVAYWTLYGSHASILELIYSLDLMKGGSISGRGGGSSSSFFNTQKRFKADATKII